MQDSRETWETLRDTWLKLVLHTYSLLSMAKKLQKYMTKIIRRGKNRTRPIMKARKVKLLNLESGKWEYTTFYLREDEPDPDPTKNFILCSLETLVKMKYGPGYLESISITTEELKKEEEQYYEDCDKEWELWKIEHGISSTEDLTINPPSNLYTLSRLSDEIKTDLGSRLRKYYGDKEIDDILDSLDQI